MCNFTDWSAEALVVLGNRRKWKFYMRVVYIFLLQISPLIVEVHLVGDYSWPKNDLMIMNETSKQNNLND